MKQTYKTPTLIANGDLSSHTRTTKCPWPDATRGRGAASGKRLSLRH